MTGTAARRVGGLVHHRDFGLLWVGQSVSDVGTGVSIVVLPLVAVVYLHASAFEVSALAALEWLPWLLVGLPAGVWVDRSRKRRLLLGCDIVRMLLMTSVPVTAAFGGLRIAQLLAVAFATGVATVVFQVAYVSYLPELVTDADLAEGNAKLQGSQSVANVVGPGLGGLLAQALRAPFALIVDAASYLVSLLALLAIQRQDTEARPQVGRTIRREIAEGARLVAADPLLRVMTIAPALANLFFGGYQALTVVFLVRSVHLGSGAVGGLIALVSLGSIVGAVLARSVGRAIGTSRAVWLVTLSTAPFGLLIPATTQGAGLAYFLAGNVIMYFGMLVYNVTIGSFRQRYCPPQILGRVVATMRFVSYGAVPLGALAGGALASGFGLRPALWILLAGNLLPGLLLAASPLRRIRDLPPRQATWPGTHEHVASRKLE